MLEELPLVRIGRSPGCNSSCRSRIIEAVSGKLLPEISATVVQETGGGASGGV